MTTLKIFSLSLALAVFSAAATPESIAIPGVPAKKTAAQAQPQIRDKWALVVGINRFVDPELKVQKFAQKSSADLARALKDADSGHFGLDHVLTVNGSQASKQGIQQAFEQWLFKKALPDDLVLVYFNTRVLTDSKNEVFLCAQDTVISDPESSGINLKDLLKNMRQRVGSKQIICLLDTNPLSPDERKAQSFDLKKLASETDVTIFSASDIFKSSYDDDAALQTRFVHYFVEAFKNGASNFPFAMTCEYVWQKLKELSATKPAQAQQAVLALSSEQSPVAGVVLGMIVKSSFPQRSPSIGHPLDKIGMDRPDIVPPTLNPAKTGVKPMRGQSLPDTLGGANKPTPSEGLSTAAKTASQLPKAVQERIAPVDEDEDEFDPNLDLSTYMSKMKQDIQKRWERPKGFESRKVTTLFTIMRDGKIANAEVVQSSGNPEVDKSALAALAAPVDPLPKGAPRSIDIKYVFDWKTKMQN